MEKGIVAFAFGSPYSIRSNAQIADITKKLLGEIGPDTPIITQQDIRLDSEYFVSHVDEVDGSPPSTLSIARQAISWSLMLEINELWVVAAKPHLARALRDTIKSSEERKSCLKISYPLMAIDNYTLESWFCTNSTQRRTRSYRQWLSREVLLNLAPYGCYKHLAK